MGKLMAKWFVLWGGFYNKAGFKWYANKLDIYRSEKMIKYAQIIWLVVFILLFVLFLIIFFRIKY